MDQLQAFFKEDKSIYKDKGIILFDFDDSKSEDFIQHYVIPFRRSYLCDEDLAFEVDKGINIRVKAIENKLPTAANLKSGEFGEILMFFLACKFICPAANVTPLKWQWKENRDTPCHLTDIVLLKCIDKDNPQPTDYFFSMEVKSAASPQKGRSCKSRFNDAIDGANKDKNSRIGKMVAYLTTKYAKDRKAELAQIVKRFDDGTTVHYNQKISASVVSERDSLQYHIKNITADNLTLAQNENIALFAVPMAKLKEIYEKLYSIIPIKG